MVTSLRSETILSDSRLAWVIAVTSVALFMIANLPWQLDDYDQAKQAFTSFEMVNAGKWFYQTTPHDRVATKPPLVGWVSAGLFSVNRSWEWAWRLPSLAAAIALGWLLFRYSQAAHGRMAATLAIAAFAFNLMAPRLASLVRTDMPLALVIFAVGALVWRKIRESEPWRPNDRLWMFVLLTAGMMIKGPVVWAFLLPGLILFQLWKGKVSASAFPGVWPWIASLMIFAIWVVGGIRFMPGFYDEVVVREFLGRFGGETHRAQPVLFYLPHLLHKFAPWSVLMIALGLLQCRNAGWDWRKMRISPGTAWLICWIAGGLLVMSLLPSKRVDRIFPVIPPLCLLLGAQIAAVRSPAPGQLRIIRWVTAALVLAVVMSAGYFGWKTWAGYRDNRAALSDFGRTVRQQTVANGWRYEVIASRDEGMLLYLRKLRFELPQTAIEQWNAGQLDALVVSTRDEIELSPKLVPAAMQLVRSSRNQDADTLEYILLARRDQH